MSRPATTRLKVNPPLGMRPSLEFRPLHQLAIDAGYQRTIDTGPSKTLIRRIAQFWDWGLCQPLVVAKREDGTLVVVDGQHRLAAARLRNDIYDLPCVVSAYSSAGDEAAAFVALNQQRKPLGKLDLFKAAIAAEDAEAIQITGLIKSAGLSVAPHGNPTAWKPGMIANIGGVERVLRRWGADVAEQSLTALAQGFPGQVMQFAGTIFPGIAGVIGGRAEKKAETSIELLGLVLQGAEQKEWVTEIRLELAAASVRSQVAATRVIGRAYDEAEADA